MIYSLEKKDSANAQAPMAVVAPAPAPPNKGKDKHKSSSQSAATNSVPLTASMLSASGARAVGVHGLSNLGNTCFFNSVMQNLVVLPDMLRYFVERPPLTVESELTAALRALLTSFWNPSNTSSSINPSHLFSCISKKASRFRGRQQQDAHELLRYLIEGIHAEEVQRVKQNSGTKGAAGEAPGKDGNTVPAKRLLDPANAVDQIFGGELSSIVTCTVCGHRSITREAFHDLSLAIPLRFLDKWLVQDTEIPGSFSHKHKHKHAESQTAKKKGSEITAVSQVREPQEPVLDISTMSTKQLKKFQRQQRQEALAKSRKKGNKETEEEKTAAEKEKAEESEDGGKEGEEEEKAEKSEGESEKTGDAGLDTVAAQETTKQIKEEQPQKEEEEEKEEKEKEKKKVDNVSYYTMLNLSPTASEQEIQSSYRRLAVAFHPDRHHLPELQKLANAQFIRLNTAYEVLIDKQKRILYDLYGEDGLKTNLQLGEYLHTPEQIKKEYERLVEERERMNARNKFKSEGTLMGAFGLHDSLLSLFRFLSHSFSLSLAPHTHTPAASRSPPPHSLPQPPPGLPPAMRQQWIEKHAKDTPKIVAPQLLKLAVSHQVTWKIRKNGKITIGTGLLTTRGRGSGTFMCGYTQTLRDKNVCGVSVSVGDPLALSLSLTRHLSPATTCTVSGVLSSEGSGLSFVSHRIITPNLSARVEYGQGSGDVDGVSLNLTHSLSHSSYSLDLSSKEYASIGVQCVRKISKRTQLRISGKLGEAESNVEVGVTRQADEGKLGIFVTLSHDGILIRIALAKEGQKLQIPFFVWPSLSVVSGCVALCVPACLLFLVKKLIIDPRKLYLANQAALKTAQKNRQEYEKLRSLAEEAQRLLNDTAVRSRARESRIGGFIVVRAVYGDLASQHSFGENDSSEFPRVTDVTVPLQALVEQSRLVLHATPKSALPGFFNPCFADESVTPSLQIDFEFQSVRRTVTISDSESLALP
eukprot:TRINITY_DN2597_c0_g1_i10.p1 TRINITY_DN2597_c0_g1~~TRINITY_DN2597_c0_g1_i10.p1  ORF type:complete len:981 (-),score=279.44 TRINITY_DN2597_c0_g1_i10:33-2975(-)